MKRKANLYCFLCKGKGYIKEYAEMSSTDIEMVACDCIMEDVEDDLTDNDEEE